MGRRSIVVGATSAALCAVLAGATAGPAAAGENEDGQGGRSPIQHLVVIYEENHSFDNLYGNWGPVKGQTVDGRPASGPGTTQVNQAGQPYPCLYQNDANLGTTSESFKWLDGTSHPGLQNPDACTGQPLPNPGQTQGGLAPSKTPTTYDSHFANKPFAIQDYVTPEDKTCAPPGKFAPNGVQKGDPQGLPGGCTRDIVHRFYQEQYQLDGGKQDRYSTGSDAAGLTQGYYDTQSLPIYQYLHGPQAPKYVLADRFFQGAFGGSFLNHQYLIAAQAPQWDTSQKPVPGGKNSVLDANGFPNKTYPLYGPDPAVQYNDSVLTQQCGATTTVPDRACGNYAVNTMQPSWAPSGGGSNVLPGINDVDPSKPFYETNIGDELSAKHVSWNWFAGGWDDANAGHPDPLFQYHHQPFNYFQNYAPGMPGRAHLKDEKDFVAAAKGGNLPAVSFVKPIGEENEHPGYASTDNGENHLVDLVKSVQQGPQGRNTLIVVTYDEFGGQWDHIAPPGQGPSGAAGPHDQFGPGTRIPALLIGGPIHSSGVDHTSYDTTSILATIERAFGVAPLSTRDAAVNDLSHALSKEGDDQGRGEDSGSNDGNHGNAARNDQAAVVKGRGDR